MPLAPGARLGPYEILAAIGAGGMGEVYRAHDTRLDRTVAIKVLPAEVSGDPDRRVRFEREARAIASLSHPHICTLHDIGTHDETTYLVMEHLTGESLAERLLRGPVPLAQALDIAAEIAEALDAAHKHGIIHRDLKPGNVMLTSGGAGRSGVTSAKLLDFGLAKLAAHGERPALAGGASVPTQAAPVTAAGTLLGTLQYMAPEQLEGKEADARTDLWALGAILYEMLTGRRAFAGGSQVSLIGDIMHADPAALATLQPLTPPALDRVVTKCLAKRPDGRWDTAHDVADELRWISETRVQKAALAREPGRRWQTRALLAAAAGAAGIALVATSLWLTWADPEVQPPSRLLLTEQRPASPADPQRSLAISRDGRTVVYAAESDSVRHLYLRGLESSRPTMIAGTAGAMAPFFSPGGDRIGFFADGQLKVVSVAGGEPVALASASNPRGGTWTRAGTIVFAPELDAGLWQIPAGGGTATLVARPDGEKRERSYRWPEILPDDDTILFTLAMSDILSFDEGRLMVRSLMTGEQRELLRGGSFPTYAESGHLLYGRAGAIVAVPFDAKRKAVTGAPSTVMPDVVTSPFNGSAQFAVSQTGTLVFVPGGSTTHAAVLKWVGKNGKTQTPALPPAAYQRARLSPDGRAAAVDVDGANASIWILDFERSAMTRLTLEWNNNGPEWSPDGSHIVFNSAESGTRQLFWQAVDGRTGRELLTSGTSNLTSSTNLSWSSDGRVLAFDRLDPKTGWDIWTLAMDGGRQQTPFLMSSFDERSPRFSPGGRWIAYTSDETGRPEVYVQPYPGPGRKSRISTEGGTFPVWARDGRSLFYWGPDHASMMSVEMVSWPARSPGQPRLLFRQQSAYPFDVAPDGRFLIIEDQPESGLLSPIAVVLNWFEELKAKAPGGVAK